MAIMKLKRRIFLVLLIIMIASLAYNYVFIKLSNSLDDDIEIIKSDGYQFVDVLANDIYVCIDSYRNIVIKRNDQYMSLHGTMNSLPEISPDSSKIAFIDEFGFEMIGNLAVYDSSSNSLKLYTDFHHDKNGDLTVKDIQWYGNEMIFIIIGYPYGTVTKGGEVYLVDLNQDSYKKVLEVDSMHEYTEINVEGDYMDIKFVKWLDDNYMEYEEMVERIKVKELLK